MRNLFNPVMLDKANEGKYSFNTIVCFSILGGHITFFLIFLLLRIKFLVITNIIGIMIYLVCFFLIKYKKLAIAVILGIWGLITVIWSQVYYLGWNGGFQDYILCIIPILILPDAIKMRIKIIFSSICVISYIFMLQVSHNRSPLVTISNELLLVFNVTNIIVVFTALTVMLLYYNKLVITSEYKLKEMNLTLERLSETDQLTELFNRRHMMKNIEDQFRLFEIKHEPFILAMADIDNFKLVNDIYGHDCGDLVLKEFSTRILEVLRQNDIVARWGGEEFLFLLAQTDLKDGIKIMERVCKIIADKPMNSKEKPINVTITIGLALYNGNCEIKDLIKIADENLYTGKLTGKNCVVASKGC